MDPDLRKIRILEKLPGGFPEADEHTIVTHFHGIRFHHITQSAFSATGLQVEMITVQRTNNASFRSAITISQGSAIVRAFVVNGKKTFCGMCEADLFLSHLQGCNMPLFYHHRGRFSGIEQLVPVELFLE